MDPDPETDDKQPAAQKSEGKHEGISQDSDETKVALA